MPLRTIFFSLAMVFVATVPSVAQGHQGGPPQGGGRLGAPGGGMRDGPQASNSIAIPVPITGEITAPTHGGLQLGPPMRWWDDKNFARTVGLNPTQQHRMDDVFTANRESLLRCYKSLQHEESQLQKMTRSRIVDENLIFQQIDRVTQARGELEKVNAHVLLQIRREMTDEQAAKLDQLNASAQ